MKRFFALCMTVVMVLSSTAFSVFADGSGCVISVADATTTPGSVVSVAVKVENNPGIQGATLTVSWDDKLTLTAAENGSAFSALTMTPPGHFVSGRNFVWYAQNLRDEDVKDGTVLVLTFQVSKSVQDGQKLPVTVSYKSGDIFDFNLEKVNPQIQNGYVTVVTYTPGDVNGDNRQTPMDLVLLSRYIADGCTTDPEGYNVKLNPNAGDVDANGRLNSLDLVYISRYIADGCTTDPEGYNVILKPSGYNFAHTHTMQAIPYKEETCTEEGHTAYWYCTSCSKYYGDAFGTTEITLGETVIAAHHIEEVIPATDTMTGGKKCTRCGEILEAPQELAKTEHGISYDIANGDPYLQELLARDEITNPNPAKYAEGVGCTLQNISAAGYRFLGWYDGAGSNAEQIKKIIATETENIELYAHWEKIPYTVQYKSSVFIDRDKDTYTVDQGLALPTPKLSNYVFAGWSDEDGHLYRSSKIPTGTTGNITLNANWTSERNKTFTKNKLDAPIIVEDANVILFAYEIGEIQNVPLYTIKDFGYISGDGVTRTATEKYSTQVDETLMKGFAESVSESTTNSSSWTLSQDWNEITSVNEQWCEENEKKVEDAETIAKSNTNTWNISNGISGSVETSSTMQNQRGYENQVKVYSEEQKEKMKSDRTLETDNKAWNVNAKLTYTPKNFSLGIGVSGLSANIGGGGGIGGELGGGYEHSWGTEKEHIEQNKEAQKEGMELSGKVNASKTATDSTTSNSAWNSSASYGGSSTVSTDRTLSTMLSEKISKSTGYGKEYAKGEEYSNSQGLSSTNAKNNEYTSSVTYGLQKKEEKENTWTTQATKPGYHRWIVAGTAHVFGVVGYDIANDAYFVYTYSVMDDEQHEFEDYSYTSAAYNDNENGVIPFEIPLEVAEYVSERTAHSSGLKVDQTTGKVTAYTGTDTCVVIPEYFNVGSGDVVKITGIDSEAFKGKTALEAVVLSDFITEIPDNAFEGCSSLIGVSGGSIQKIGAKAFSGCIKIKEAGVTSNVTELGEKAFNGIAAVIINAANADVAKAALDCGAKEIVLCTEYLKDGASALANTTLSVTGGTDYFEFNGNKQIFDNLIMISEAKATVINKATFNSTQKTPLQIASEEVILNQSSATAPGFAMTLKAENTHLGLQGDNCFVSANQRAVLSKNLNLYEINSNVDGKLVINDKLMICTQALHDELLNCKSKEVVDEDTFKRLMHSYTLTFNADGGVCSIITKEMENGVPLGDLPVPTKDYCDFAGWYLEDGTTKVTEQTVFSDGIDRKLVAHWESKVLSGWVKASKAPADAQIINTKWTYDKRSETTSSNSSLPGWTKYDETWVWGDYGNWSDWRDSSVGGSDSRQVETRQVVSGYEQKTQYFYSRWWCYSSSKGYYLAWPYKSGDCINPQDTGWLDYRLPPSGGYDGGYPQYGDKKTNDKKVWWYNEQTRQVDDYNRPIYKTQYRYRDRSKIWTYYFYKIDHLEASNNPTGGSGVSNVVKYVQYRAK